VSQYVGSVRDLKYGSRPLGLHQPVWFPCSQCSNSVYVLVSRPGAVNIKTDKYNVEIKLVRGICRKVRIGHTKASAQER
jgi:hypothetical protein